MARLGVWAALAGAATLVVSGPAGARPLTVEDVVRVERLGRTAVAPGGRVLLLERRLPYNQGARFDFDEHNDLFRTRLEIVDLSRPGAPEPLIAHDPQAGYALGPVAPDGARAAVFRLKGGLWELGVVELASRAVLWTGLTPEVSGTGRTVAWTDADRLVLIKLPEGLQPFALRIANLAPAMAERWTVMARGAPAVTVVGSGREAALSPRDPLSELVLLDVRTRAAQTLARGAFKDLEAAPSGRWVALAEAGADITLQAGKPIRGDYGTSKRRLRLVLVELGSGRLRRPCPGCDISR